MLSQIMDSFQLLDNTILNYLANHRTDSLNTLFIFVTDIGGPTSVFILCLIFLIALWATNKPKHFTLFFVSIIVVNGFTIYLKDFFDRLRPANAVLKYGGYSFPSGHSSVITLFAALVYFSYKDHISNVWWRRAFGLALGIFAGLVCFSRLYLGAHYFSDVIGGIALGLLLSWVGIVVYRR